VLTYRSAATLRRRRRRTFSGLEVVAAAHGELAGVADEPGPGAGLGEGLKTPGSA